MVRILTDDLLDAPHLMTIAIEAVTAAFAARNRGALVAPPRQAVGFPPHGDLVFTIGGSTGDDGRVGFRAYHTFGGVDSQVVAVWSPAQGALEGLVVGHRLGDLRTGAIGGVAIRHMSRADARTIGVIGTGHQARTQLEAAAAVRALTQASVFSRNRERRDTFAAAMSERLGLPVTAAPSARAAVADADIVICATDSPVPVIEAGWLRPGVHVTTVGPKSVRAHELDLAVATRAAVVATDAPEQTRAYRSPFFLEGVPANDALVDLADIVAGTKSGRLHDEDVTLFCSAGLAGTEVLVAARLLEALG